MQYCDDFLAYILSEIVFARHHYTANTYRLEVGRKYALQLIHTTRHEDVRSFRVVK